MNIEKFLYKLENSMAEENLFSLINARKTKKELYREEKRKAHAEWQSNAAKAIPEIEKEIMKIAKQCKSKTKIKLPWKLDPYVEIDPSYDNFFVELMVFTNEWVMNEYSEEYIEGSFDVFNELCENIKNSKTINQIIKKYSIDIDIDTYENNEITVLIKPEW